MSQEAVSEKRVSKCPGCATPLAEHTWGIPNKFCEGEEISSPKGKKASKKAAADDQQITELERELAELNLDEERREKTNSLSPEAGRRKTGEVACRRCGGS